MHAEIVAPRLWQSILARARALSPRAPPELHDGIDRGGAAAVHHLQGAIGAMEGKAQGEMPEVQRTAICRLGVHGWCFCHLVWNMHAALQHCTLLFCVL